MRNILNAIIEFVGNNTYIVNGRATIHGGSVMNALGDNLEDYIVDLFAGTLNESDKDKRSTQINNVFSYIGNSTNPPDAMIKAGDAIEVKKIKGDSQLQLNSSYPKHKLYKNDTHLCDRCRTCETWEVKDMLYVVGIVPNDVKIKSLFFTYGLTYAAENEVYENIVKQMKKGIEEIDGPVFAETKELGRVNQIDLLKRTNLRLRGMYLMDNPWNAYGYPISVNGKELTMYALIPEEKYNSFDNVQMFEEYCATMKEMKIENVEVPDPTYEDKKVKCKLITFMK